MNAHPQTLALEGRATGNLSARQDWRSERSEIGHRMVVRDTPPDARALLRRGILAIDNLGRESKPRAARTPWNLGKQIGVNVAATGGRLRNPDQLRRPTVATYRPEGVTTADALIAAG